MKTVLITGVAGFLGRHFAAHLHGEGWTVEGIDVRKGTGFGDRVMDARDFFRGLGGLGGRPGDYDLVIHAAAVVGGRSTIENDPLSLAVNLELDAALFRWARVIRPGRVVYLSSSAAYPTSFQREAGYKLHEKDIQRDVTGIPDGLYGWAKLTGEYLARLAREAGVAVTVVRPFSGYGSDQDASYPFPALTDRALRREDPFLIWGTGEQVRDFVHVDDIVMTVMEMVRREHNGPVNIGWGRPVTMRELAGKICTVAGHSPQFEPVPSAPSGVAWRVCDPSRLWDVRMPQISLDAGIYDALEYRKRFLRG